MGHCLRCEIEGYATRLREREDGGDGAECPRCGPMDQGEMKRLEAEYCARAINGLEL